MDFSNLNPDGSWNDGTPSPRPIKTPAEAEMSDFAYHSLPQTPQEDGPGWLKRQWDRVAFKNAKPGDDIFQTMF